MTNLMSEMAECRGEFEKWYTETMETPVPQRYGDGYEAASVSVAWYAWQAAYERHQAAAKGDDENTVKFFWIDASKKLPTKDDEYHVVWVWPKENIRAVTNMWWRGGWGGSSGYVSHWRPKPELPPTPSEAEV